MSSLLEIEEAIETLPREKVVALVRWLDDYQAMTGAAETLGEFYAEEESCDAKNETTAR